MAEKKLFTVLKRVLLILIVLGVSAASCMLFILICSSSVAVPIIFFCSAVLCLLPAAAAKLSAYALHIRSPKILASLACIGYALSLWLTLCSYVSQGYESSVYGFMKHSNADDYYFGGYEEFKKDYKDTEDFIRQLKAAPASIVLDGMDKDKLAGLSADELAQINRESLWDYCGFDDILGPDIAEVEASMKKAAEMNAYDFTFKYRSLTPKTFGYMLTHPHLLFDELKYIIKDSSQKVGFPLLIFFMIVQIIIIRIVARRLFINEGREIVFVTEPLKDSKKNKE